MRIQANPNVWEQLRNDAIHRTAANLRAANKGNSVVKKLGSFLLSHTFKINSKNNKSFIFAFNFIPRSFSFSLHWISKICERVMAQIRHHNPHSPRLKHSQSIHLLILHFDLRLRMQPRAQATSLSSSPIPTHSSAPAARNTSARATSQTAGNKRRTRNAPTKIARSPSSRGSACTPRPPAFNSAVVDTSCRYDPCAPIFTAGGSGGEAMRTSLMIEGDRFGSVYYIKTNRLSGLRKSGSRLRAYPGDFPKTRRSKCSSEPSPAGSPIPRGSRDGAGLSRSPPRFEERGGFGPKSGRPAIYGPKSKRKTAETFVEKLSSSSEREARRLQIGFWRKEGMKNRGKLFDWLTR